MRDLGPNMVVEKLVIHVEIVDSWLVSEIRRSAGYEMASQTLASAKNIFKKFLLLSWSVKNS